MDEINSLDMPHFDSMVILLSLTATQCEVSYTGIR